MVAVFPKTNKKLLHSSHFIDDSSWVIRMPHLEQIWVGPSGSCMVPVVPVVSVVVEAYLAGCSREERLTGHQKSRRNFLGSYPDTKRATDGLQLTPLYWVEDRTLWMSPICLNRFIALQGY